MQVSILIGDTRKMISNKDLSMFLKWKIAQGGVLNFARQFHTKFFSMGSKCPPQSEANAPLNVRKILAVSMHWPDRFKKWSIGWEDQGPCFWRIFHICPSLERNQTAVGCKSCHQYFLCGGLQEYHLGPTFDNWNSSVEFLTPGIFIPRMKRQHSTLHKDFKFEHNVLS